MSATLKPAPMTAKERQAAYRSRKRAIDTLNEEKADIKLYELSDVDVKLIQSMLRTRIELAANADAKTEYRDLSRRLELQSA